MQFDLNCHRNHVKQYLRKDLKYMDQIFTYALGKNDPLIFGQKLKNSEHSGAYTLLLRSAFTSLSVGVLHKNKQNIQTFGGNPRPA